MFTEAQGERLRIYKNIFDNLSACKIEAGISSLRRLEIRFLPLDPVLAVYLFKALQKNFVLQELILTDDCLQHCGLEEFEHLFDAISLNQHSGLTLLDLSRNPTTFDDNERVHEALVAALAHQRRKKIPRRD